MDFFRGDDKRAVEAKEEAQKIAWAPFVFQTAKALKALGILKIVDQAGEEGYTTEQVAHHSNISRYGARVLLEAGLGSHIFYLTSDDKFALSKTGFFILRDEMTNVTMNFVNDVCYQGLYYLQDAIINQKPEGLKVFGEWDTVYEALNDLPPDARESWYAFDHYFSDVAFSEVIPRVLKHKPRMIYDVGGNTGEFTEQIIQADHHVKVTLIDLPGQIRTAKEKLNGQLDNRVYFHPIDLRDQEASFPTGADTIWMSQFLDCFSEEEITSILQRAKGALTDDGNLHIMETFWDRQRFEAGAFSLQQLSLYFTTIANGNSQMYHSKVMINCLHEAGFYVEEDIDQVGIGHTLLTCRKKR
ncbi:MAG: SAM-dependent methyltransferase [Bacteroidetes bacterium SW_11_45_7]|nr:MAG: SAM-dependent methyltransferase [Bacteroidetes bacterium SW_11_45_7]